MYFCSLCLFLKIYCSIYFGSDVEFLFVVFISSNIFIVSTLTRALYLCSIIIQIYYQAVQLRIVFPLVVFISSNIYYCIYFGLCAVFLFVNYLNILSVSEVVNFISVRGVYLCYFFKYICCIDLSSGVVFLFVIYSNIPGIPLLL